MHELSIAVSIVEMAQEESGRRGGARIDAVHLKLGALSGVVKEALLSSYDLACENTALRDSRLIIEEVPVVVYCPQCKARRTLKSPQRFVCPECNTVTPEIIEGRDLELVALELRE